MIISKRLSIHTPKQSCLIDITESIKQIVEMSTIENGQITVFVPHTTAGITINENADPDVLKDMLYGLSKIVPNDVMFKHLEGNSTAHIKSSLMGSSVTLLVVNKQCQLGVWQSVYLCEFDGPRVREYQIQLIGD